MTVFRKVLDNAGTTLDGAIDDSQLSIDVIDGSEFPLTVDCPCILTIEANTANMEKILVTANATNTLTVDASGRGYEGSVAKAHASGAKIELLYVATNITELQTAVNNRSRSATLVVAASNASTASKDAADYLCDGIADEVQIQDAIDALIADSGGTLQFTEGMFNIEATIAYEIPTGALKIDLVGRGISTQLYNDQTLGENCIEVNGTENHYMGGSIRDLLIYGDEDSGAAIYLDNTYGFIIDKVMLGHQTVTDHFWGTHGVEIIDSYIPRITNTTIFYMGGCGVKVHTGTNTALFLDGCEIAGTGSYNISLADLASAHITRNYLEQANATVDFTLEHPILYLDASVHTVTINDNYFVTGTAWNMSTTDIIYCNAAIHRLHLINNHYMWGRCRAFLYINDVGSTRFNIANNMLGYNNSSAEAAYFLYLKGDDHIVTRNNFHGYGSVVAVYVADGEDISIENNRATNCATAVDINRADAIRTHIQGNDFQGCTADISSASATTPLIRNNIDKDGDWASGKITNVVDPTADQDAATKKYVDDQVAGDYVEDDVYGAGWDADTTHAPSQNAVYDKVETLVPKSLYDANSILAATSDDTPIAVTVAEQTLVGRITSGAIDDLSVAQVRTLLGLTNVRTILFVIDGGGSVIATGIHGDAVVDYSCTIVGATLISDRDGAIAVDIWKSSYTDFDNSSHPVDDDSIVGTALAIAATSSKYQDTTLTSWATAITAGDILRFNVDSVTTIQRVTIALKVTTG